MLGGFRSSEVFKGTKIDLSRHWLRILAALMLALMIASADQTQPVQASPASEIVKWYMDVLNPKTTICIGETVEYSVKVYSVNAVVPGPEWALPGIKIDAISSNKSVGDFKKDTAITGFASEDLVTAGFSFTAKKPGKANLYFEGMVDKKLTSSYVEFTVPVTVIPCKFKVIATSRMAKCYVGGCLNFLGVATGNVTADENGSFTGTAQVVWTTGASIPTCSAKTTMGKGNVNMHGNLNENSLLFLELNYEPVPWKNAMTCAGGKKVNESFTETVSPLNVIVPSATAVTVTLNQTLSDEAGFIDGSANVNVIPLDGAK